VWPYVNGKALVHGLSLEEMDASDMLDVLHFFFEEDHHYVSEESAKSRSSLREALYKDLYNRTYKYAYTSAKKQPGMGDFDADDYGTFSVEQADALSVNPFNPRERETKPYVAPTPMNANSPNPFGGILDSPLN
jgi:hypothetical protein